MPKHVVFKAFRTPRYPYIYDRHTNTAVVFTEDDYQEMKRVESGELPADQSPVVEKYQRFGLFQPNTVEQIEHPGDIHISIANPWMLIFGN